MIPVRGYDGKRVGVLGLGRSGLATARALRAGGADPICWDDNVEARSVAQDERFTVADLTKERTYEGIAAVITSPGIPHLYPSPHPAIEMAQRQGAVIDNDIGLFFRSFATEDWEEFERAPRIVCVTGSNGKSTTTALIVHILKQAGHDVQMGGNIGRGVLDLDPARDGMVVVLELSSYQTELARALSPDIAVFLNLSPDHLDRHGGMGGYFAAKRRLFSQGGPERAIIGVDEREGRYLAAQLREEAEQGDPVIRISSGTKLSGDGWSVFARKGFLAEWRKGRQVASVDLREVSGLPGAHNHQNACAAWAAARALNLGPRQIEGGLRSYPGLRHRCQTVGEVRGVRLVNDSKATNADAAEQALKAFKRIRWIAGGVAKEGGIASLLPLMDRVEKTYLIGEAAHAFSEQLGEHPHKVSGTLEAAFADALADAVDGETILLAPACASFDQFPSFEARGEAFEQLASNAS
ncbi:UDP-N-acetylmuramoyl-L-alanine--D-glutamate ligase [Pontivivens insulae]|uniref:UDP-N-acetylmuramoylalanine--D-glutamate ligase n=1 Tax=Pontivivens insulae TaxID=1639689 RepID=A0A2R8AFL1_9RHOB|nr:UDP-N-acetylmuramoyl-L-alanine--D-glutamate ligase [Pontivivens insulae]RED12252.1 UDP-N-acetylmuramoylalanine--D-glutamate ligase [Pontivivens insulae]SPF31009.1 UDP-N-acetylmuramoylalanine--D-glutamate ligase [Pontivivens insulae]